MPVRWLETEPRFPRPATGPGLRDDLTNNGWCHMRLMDKGGLHLTYVDWLGCKRFFASYSRDPSGELHLEESRAFDRRTRFEPTSVPAQPVPPT